MSQGSFGLMMNILFDVRSSSSRALLIAERGVVCKLIHDYFGFCLTIPLVLLVFRNQEISVQEQLDLGRYYGPLHKHAAAAMPKDPALEELLGTRSILCKHMVVTILM